MSFGSTCSSNLMINSLGRCLWYLFQATNQTFLSLFFFFFFFFFLENCDGFKAQTMGAVCGQGISTFLKSCSAAPPGPPLFMWLLSQDPPILCCLVPTFKVKESFELFSILELAGGPRSYICQHIGVTVNNTMQYITLQKYKMYHLYPM
jgi:hypothetical protein